MAHYHTPTVPLLSEWHIQAIKARIDEGLRIRGINVETTLALKEREGEKAERQHLTLTSTPFNTFPVIHSSITIEEFGGRVVESTRRASDSEEEIPTVRFYVHVHARYEGNGVGLFTVKGEMQPHRSHAIFFESNINEGDRDVVFESDMG